MDGGERMTDDGNPESRPPAWPVCLPARRATTRAHYASSHGAKWLPPPRAPPGAHTALGRVCSAVQPMRNGAGALEREPAAGSARMACT